MERRTADDVVRGLGTTSDKIRALGREGYEPGEISRALDIRYQFAYNVLARAGLLGTTRTKTGDDLDAAALAEENAAEVDEAIERTFSLESDLQQALRQNIGQLEAELIVIDEGKEKRVTSGFIDITAKDRDGKIVAIELKAVTADRKAVGQLLSYMGDLMSEGAEAVRGTLVAPSFAESALSAARAAGNITLMRYTFRFAFEAVK